MGHGTRRRQPHSALLRVALIAVAVPGVSAPAAAADATLAPTNDTQLDQAAARANFGHARRLDVTSRPRRRVLLRFRLRGAPGRAVAAATLRLWSPGASAGRLRIHRSACPPRPGRVTWRNRPALGRRIAGPARIRARWNRIRLPRAAVAGRRVLCLQLTTRRRGRIRIHALGDRRAPRLVLRTARPAAAPVATAPAAAAAPSGPQLYVAPGGSDGWPCTATQPCRTLNRADAVAVPGTTVNVGPGTYDGATLSRTGTPAARTRFVSTQRWAARLTGAVRLAGAYMDLEGFDVTTARGNVVVTLSGTGTRAIANVVHSLSVGCSSGGGAGILAAGPRYDTSGQAIIGNVVSNIGGGSCSLVQAIYSSAPDVTIAGNLATRSSGAGIHLWHGATRNTIAGNTVADNGRGIIVGHGDDGATSAGDTGTRVTGNIVAFNADNRIAETGNARANVYANNLMFGAQAGYSVNSAVTAPPVIADPVFRNRAAGDYGLAAGSPAAGLGAGV